LTITSDNFFKPEKMPANQNVGPAVERAHLIVAEEAAARVLKTQKLREARLALETDNSRQNGQ
jgi:hypothetical protein